MIVGQNSLLNQYVPTFYIKDLKDGQGIIYDSTRRAFVNAPISGGTGGASRLGELLDVSDSVDNPISLQNGQALVYNTFTSLWENQFIDYNTLLNKPTSLGTVTSVAASGGTTGLTFTGSPITTAGILTLGGTLAIANGGTGATTQEGAANSILPSQTGNAGRFLTTDGTNVSWSTISGTGTVTSVGVSSANSAISVSGSPITTSGIITITANQFTSSASGIVPASGGGTTNFLRADGTWVAPSGTGTVTSVTVNGSTGRITSTGSPITSSGSITLDLATTGVSANTYGSATQVPVFTVDAYGRITSVTNTIISAGTGTVTSVAASGGTTGLTFTGSPITTSGTLTLGGTLAIANGGTGQTTASGAINALVPSQTGNSGRVLGTNGTTVSWVTAGTGTVTSVGVSSNGTHSAAITIGSSPVTSSGTITITPNLFTTSTSGVVPGSGGGTTNFLRADGTWAAPAGGSGTVTSVNVSGGTTGLTFTGGPVTTSGTITMSGTLDEINGGTGQTTYATGDILYASAANTLSKLPIGSDGQVLTISGGAPTWAASGGGGGSTETVVFRYSSGGAGNLSPGDALVSETAGVTATITDGVNCLVNFAFTGKSAPPVSITIYGQNYSANTFSIVTPPSVNAALANYRIAGGGTAASPDLANGIFSSANIVTLQIRMTDTGASAGLGQRAHAIVRFGF